MSAHTHNTHTQGVYMNMQPVDIPGYNSVLYDVNMGMPQYTAYGMHMPPQTYHMQPSYMHKHAYTGPNPYMPAYPHTHTTHAHATHTHTHTDAAQ